MSLFEARIRAAQAERRRSARFTVDIPVVLRTVSGDRPCRMANISDNGAKLEMASIPAKGVTGWLIMGAQELYCTVVWTRDRDCGVEFERSLPEASLIEIAGDQVRAAGPVANAGNIQMGRKRSGLLVRSEG